MKNLFIDSANGVIYLNLKKIAPLQKVDFLETCAHNDFYFKKIFPNNEWETYGIEVKINELNFGLNITYHKNNLHSLWLTWDGGISQKKGYDTTESELLLDKKYITKFLKNILDSKPQEENHANDKFVFPWGYISSTASLKSTIVSIGIGWH